jgi:hypothetical protein
MTTSMGGTLASRPPLIRMTNSAAAFKARQSPSRSSASLARQDAAQFSTSARAACTRLHAGSLGPAVAHTRARHCSSPAAL